MALPPDGSNVTASTYPSMEYDRPAEKVNGVLKLRAVKALAYTQCWVSGVQVDPATVKEAAGEEATQIVTVHRGGKTFQEKRKKADHEDSEHEDKPLADEDKAAATKGLDAETYAELPAEARPPQSTLDKAKDLAIAVAAKAMTWLHQFSESTVGKMAAAIADAALDSPNDMKRFGYNPNTSSGTANPKVSDAVSNAIAEHLGFGVSGHIVASIAANVLSRVVVWAKHKLTGPATEDTDGDPLQLLSEFIAKLFDHLAEKYGTDGAPDAATVLGHLKELVK